MSLPSESAPLMLYEGDGWSSRCCICVRHCTPRALNSLSPSTDAPVPHLSSLRNETTRRRESVSSCERWTCYTSCMHLCLPLSRTNVIFNIRKTNNYLLFKKRIFLKINVKKESSNCKEAERNSRKSRKIDGRAYKNVDDVFIESI